MLATAHHPSAASPMALLDDLTPDTMSAFLTRVGRWALLTPAQEIALAKRIERGDLAAKEHMICANLRLVVHLARRYQGLGMALADLVQEGSIGLIRAVEKFDHRRGYRFSTYATLWVRQALQRGTLDKAREIRVPSNVGQQLTKVKRAGSELAVKLGRDPTSAEISEATNLSAEQLAALDDIAYVATSLDCPVGEDSDTPLRELLDRGHSPDPTEEIWRADTRRAVHAGLHELEERDALLVRLRFGIGGGEPQGLAQIGRRLGISPEAVRQAEERALNRLADSDALQAAGHAA